MLLAAARAAGDHPVELGVAERVRQALPGDVDAGRLERGAELARVCAARRRRARRRAPRRSAPACRRRGRARGSGRRSWPARARRSGAAASAGRPPRRSARSAAGRACAGSRRGRRPPRRRPRVTPRDPHPERPQRLGVLLRLHRAAPRDGLGGRRERLAGQPLGAPGGGGRSRADRDPVSRGPRRASQLVRLVGVLGVLGLLARALGALGVALVADQRRRDPDRERRRDEQRGSGPARCGPTPR